MKVDGKCLCGYIAYEAEVDPARVVICHCTDCQTNSGTAYGVVAVVVGDSFRLLQGELKEYVKTAESGRHRRQRFCPECGTRIMASPPDGEPGLHSLRVGSVTQRAQLPPVAQLWTRSALDWTQNLEGLPHFPTGPGR